MTLFELLAPRVLPRSAHPSYISFICMNHKHRTLKKIRRRRLRLPPSASVSKSNHRQPTTTAHKRKTLAHDFPLSYLATIETITMSETKPLVGNGEDVEMLRRLKAYQP